uniref:Uncharacterized protein n=1 Tax=Rhizophora mucronata TaxID=61149 RepID=A0A2P2NG84_RHIMU
MCRDTRISQLRVSTQEKRNGIMAVTLNPKISSFCLTQFHKFIHAKFQLSILNDGRRISS